MLNITKEKLTALTQKHIERYEDGIARARAGDRTYVEEEGVHYLRIWRGIQAKDCDPERLVPFERAEVLEALDDEEPGSGVDGSDDLDAGDDADESFEDWDDGETY